MMGATTPTSSMTEVAPVTFMSYNSTGISSVKCKWICDICDDYSVDYLCIQEHFKKTKTIDKYFRENFPKFNSYVIPGYRAPGQDTGRCKAGLAQLSSKSYAVKKDRVTTHGYRIQAQVLNMPTCKILWLNTYMPTDPLRIHEYDDADLREALQEVESILTSCSYTDIVWAGDLNWDMSRVTMFSRTMAAFMEKLGLVSLWSEHPVKYTYLHTDYKSMSVLDHFMLSPRLLPLVEDCGVVERGDNLSGHSPVWVSLRLGSLPVKKSVKSFIPKKPAWCKANEEDKMLFTKDLENKLRSIPVPLAALCCEDPHCQDLAHSEDRDSFMLDILLSLVECSYTRLPLSGGGAGGGRGGRGCARPIPGWTEVEMYRKEARFWHGVWLKEKRPSRGWLHSTMVKYRRQYHYAVRRAKGKASHTKAEKLFEAAMKGDTDLISEMKKIRNGSGNMKEELPDNVGNANGEEEIVEKFKEVYSSLYSSSGSEPQMQLLSQEVNNLISKQSNSEVARITGQIVKEAALSMKPGKGDVSGGFTSDAIRHGPDILFDHLAAVFRSFLFHGTVTPSLLACCFLPLLKSSIKDPADTSSYRAIAGSSLFLKLFENVILLVWGHLLSSDSLQFGFKGNTSTTQCTWLVTEVVQHYLRNGSNPIVTVLDCSKAFDTCKFDTMFSRLLEKGLPPIVVRVMMTVYKDQYAWIKWGKERSEIFPILNGTRQGSVASPTLWAVYCDPLIQELRKLGLGAHIGGMFMGVTMYADDLLLIAPTRGSMQLMLEVCENYAKDYNICFSTDPNPQKSKSKCIYMSGKNRNVSRPAPLILEGRELPWVEAATHLGHELHQSGLMEHDAKVKRAEFINKAVEIRETFGFASPIEILRALKVYCSNFYGSMLWDLSGEGASKVFNSWNTAIKLAWNCPRETRTYLVQQVLAPGLDSARTDILVRYAKFFQSLRKSVSKEVAMLANLVSRDIRTSTGANLRVLEEASGLCPWTGSKLSLQEAICTREAVKVQESDTWRIPMLDKLLTTRQSLKYMGEEEEVSRLSDLIHSLCIN